MSTNYDCSKCGAMAFGSVFLLPGEELPDDVKLRRYLKARLTDKELEQLGVEFHGPCGRCLFTKAVELGLVKASIDTVLKQPTKADSMEIEIFS